MTKGDLREEWKGIVDEFRDSGLTVAEWSRKHGIRAGKLYYWVAKFRHEDLLPIRQIGQWLEIDAEEPPVSATAFEGKAEEPYVSTAVFEVKVGNATIVVRPGFDPELLSGIVKALGPC